LLVKDQNTPLGPNIPSKGDIANILGLVIFGHSRSHRNEFPNGHFFVPKDIGKEFPIVVLEEGKGKVVGVRLEELIIGNSRFLNDSLDVDVG
jgi:hypothetical protein